MISRSYNITKFITAPLPVSVAVVATATAAAAAANENKYQLTGKTITILTCGKAGKGQCERSRRSWTLRRSDARLISLR